MRPLNFFTNSSGNCQLSGWRGARAWSWCCCPLRSHPTLRYFGVRERCGCWLLPRGLELFPRSVVVRKHRSCDSTTNRYLFSDIDNFFLIKMSIKCLGIERLYKSTKSSVTTESNIVCNYTVVRQFSLLNLRDAIELLDLYLWIFSIHSHLI